MRGVGTIVGICALVVAAASFALANEPAATERRTPDPERGYRLILDKPYVPPTFDEEDFGKVWTTWAEPARSAAEKANPAERRRMTFDRYGLTGRPEDPTKPLQYVVDERGRWAINCFACHGGQVEGRVVPGLPNAHLALQDLIDDMGRLALREKKMVTWLSVKAWQQLPLGGTHGTTNATVFGIALESMRDRDLVVVSAPQRTFLHHDLDAPPWWNVHRRSRFYVDGLVEKAHRPLMQFVLVPTNGPERLRSWEPDFEDVLAYIESLRAPPWPHEVDRALAAQGKKVFDATCARCHGTYGSDATYPGVAVPIAEVGTDPLRLRAVTREQRTRFADSWLTGYRPAAVDADPVGYVAPPLDGVWASAPYLHNGSVPTLWHLLHPDARPKAWRRRAPTAYDVARVGLDVEERTAPPEGLVDPWERRAWFDVAGAGKSAEGHRFPDALSEPERRAVLEYLKTL